MDSTTGPGPATGSAEVWSAADLAHALWLALGPAPRGGPDLGAAAAALGVTRRSVQRWLSGTTHPTDAHAAALRTLIAPPSQALRAQADEARWAREAAALIGAARGRGISPAWRARGWHRPHLMQVLAQPDLGVRRVEVVLADPVKRPSRGGWELVSSQAYPHRPAALVAKHELLEVHRARRVRIRPGLVSAGQHLCWLAASPASPGEGTSPPERLAGLQDQVDPDQGGSDQQGPLEQGQPDTTSQDEQSTDQERGQ